MQIALFIVFGIIFPIGMIHVFSMITWDKKIEYTIHNYAHENVSERLNGLKFAMISDVHSISEKRLVGLADYLRKESLDFLFLVGDIQNKQRTKGLAEKLDVLSSIPSKYGTYGVSGNHDIPELLYDEMEHRKMHPLVNSGVSPVEGLYLAGIEDRYHAYSKDKFDVEEAVSFSKGTVQTFSKDERRHKRKRARKSDGSYEALAMKTALVGAKEGDFTLLLCHNPDVLMESPAAHADLTLSGHVHGGHVTFFGIWAPMLTFTKRVSAYGQKFMGGFTNTPIGTVYVGRGIGAHTVPRVFSPPEVAIFTLEKK